MRLVTARNMATLAVIWTASLAPALAANDVSGFIHVILGHAVDEKYLAQTFDVNLELTRNQPGEIRFEGAGPVLTDHTRVERLEWTRYTGREPVPGVIRATIAGRCVPVAELEAAFPQTTLIALPTHGYADAVAMYRTQADGATVEFYINFHTHCLATVKIFKS